MTTSAVKGTLEITRIFDAPLKRVFDSWMNREEWQAWIGPEGIDCDVPLHEPYVGGRYRLIMHLTDGSIINVAGVFKSIDAPRQFAFTWGAEDGSTPQTLVTVTLKDLGGKTELTLRHEGLETTENRDSHKDGWDSALNDLARYLAR